MRPFGCPFTILNAKDHLGKFDGKADEGFFVGYSLNSKAFKVFNNITRIVEENLHIKFNENTPNITGSGPNWIFDIDELTRTMNYEPIVAGTQSNNFAGTKACDDAGKARIKTVLRKDYILLPLWTADLLISQESKSSQDDGFQPLSDDGKKVYKDPRQESECLGYNVVPPPHTRNFMPPKLDLSGLEEFINEPIVSEPTVKKPVVETSKAKTSAHKPKVVKKNFGSPLIKDWISDSEDEADSKPKIEKKLLNLVLLK
nr:retrovirus-related Pol polyprotein from transposon TNT 1-94 [Tanacetum cinerariifolium]